MQKRVYNNEISFPISVSILYGYFYYCYWKLSVSDEQNLFLDAHLDTYTDEWRLGRPVIQINTL
jgi:hypothetical protein